jgi:hypothetical protein
MINALIAENIKHKIVFNYCMCCTYPCHKPKTAFYVVSLPCTLVFVHNMHNRGASFTAKEITAFAGPHSIMSRDDSLKLLLKNGDQTGDKY